MKNQTFGVEIEMNHITRKQAAMKAAEFFGTNRYQDTAFRNGYYTWSAWDAKGRTRCSKVPGMEVQGRRKRKGKRRAGSWGR